MSTEDRRELEESESTINHLYSQLDSNKAEQEEINNIVKEINLMGEGEHLVHLVGEVLTNEKVSDAKMELGEKLNILKEEEKKLQEYLDSEKRRNERLQKNVH